MRHRMVHLQYILNLSQHDTNLTSILESGYQCATFNLSQFDRIYFKRNKIHVVYQCLIAVITLAPTAVKTSITDILKQAISPPK